jgi:hypothetical protein
MKLKQFIFAHYLAILEHGDADFNADYRFLRQKPYNFFFSSHDSGISLCCFIDKVFDLFQSVKYKIKLGSVEYSGKY